MRLIDLDELLKYPIRLDSYDKKNGNEHFVFGIESVLEYAENLPIIDAVDLISRKDAIDAVEKAKTAKSADGEIFCAKINAQMNIQHLPSVQTERKKGKWIGKPIAGYSTVRCSCCEEVFLENEGKWNYCPNCGAYMKGKKNDKGRSNKKTPLVRFRQQR